MRKVLATTMAGAMIFGMSTASFAALNQNVTIDKSSGDYDYVLYLYEPDESISTNTGYDWSESTQEAYDDYLKEYDKFVSKVKDEDDLKEYLLEGNERGYNIFTRYADFYDACKYDVNGDLTVATKLDLPALSDAHVGNTTVNTLQVGTLTTATINGYSKDDCLAMIRGVQNSTKKWSIPGIKGKLKNVLSSSHEFGDGKYVYDNKDEINLTDGDVVGGDNNVTYLFNYGKDRAGGVDIKVTVKHKDSLRVDVGDGKVKATRKKMETNNEYDTYKVTIDPAWGPRDLVHDIDDFFDWTVELDIDSNDAGSRDPGTFYIKGSGAYSDFQLVEPDDRLQVTKSEPVPNENRANSEQFGCAFYFDQKITDETRIKVNEYVDLYFDGNYGTDVENLRALTSGDSVKEIEDFFEDDDIDYYDFVGTPKFATEVTVIIDADANSYIYEFDKATGELENITDSADYTSDGWKFKRKNLKTYVVMEDEYDGGNVKAEKEPVVDSEPEPEEPEVSEPTTDDANQNAKPNPGTGAYPA